MTGIYLTHAEVSKEGDVVSINCFYEQDNKDRKWVGEVQFTLDDEASELQRVEEWFASKKAVFSQERHFLPFKLISFTFWEKDGPRAFAHFLEGFVTADVSFKPPNKDIQKNLLLILQNLIPKEPS